MNKHWNESDHHFFLRAAEKAFDTLSVSASSGKVGIAFQTVTVKRNGTAAQSTTSTVHSFEITAAQLVTALGTTAVNRATADANGNNIASTYSTISHTHNYLVATSAIGAECTTVAATKTELKNRFSAYGEHKIGSPIQISDSITSNWDNDDTAFYLSSVATFIDINQGYENINYGEFLVASWWSGLGYTRINGGNWESIHWLETQDNTRGYLNAISKNNNTLTITPKNGTAFTFTNTTYQNKSAEENGTDVSLVTTGEKYKWNTAYLPLAGGTMTGTTNLGTVSKRITGFNFYTAASSNAETFVQFYKSTTANGLIGYWNEGDTKGAIYILPTQNPTGTYWYGGSYGLFLGGNETIKWYNKPILHSGNYSSYALPLSGGSMTGPLKWANNSIAEKTFPDYILCMESFAGGGATKWALKSNVEIGFSNSLRETDHHIVSTRRTTANDTFADGGLHYYLATSSMTTGKPEADGHILHMAWDSNHYESQLAVIRGNDLIPHIQLRYSNTVNSAPSWGSWYTVLDQNNYSAYALPKAGGTMTGGIDLATAGGSQGMVMGAYTIGASGHVSGSTGNLINFTSLKDKGSFAGSIYPTYYNGESLAWQAIISVRHRNGAGDGASYGMYIRTNLTTDGSLVWNKQYGTNSYIGERTILDSANYKNHITDIPNITAPTAPVTAYEPFTNKANVSSSKGTETNVKYVAIKGNTVVWNQLSNKNYTAISEAGITGAKQSSGKYKISGTATGGVYRELISGTTVTKGHKYLFVHGVSAAQSGSTWQIYLGTTTSVFASRYTIQNGTIMEALSSAVVPINIAVYNGTTVDYLLDINVFDLTLMFGAGNEPSYAEFNELFPFGNYPYNAGELVSFNGNIKSCGRNLWNEQWAYGDISGTTGEDVTSAARHIYGESFIPVNPSTTLYISVINHSNIGGWIYHYDGNKNFISAYQTLYNKEIAIPENVYYIRIAPWLGNSNQYYPGPYKHDICVNVSDSSFNGTYEPYKERTIDLNIKNIKNSIGDVMFPDGLCSAGTAYDELSSKMAIKRIGKVDLGTLTWVVYGAGGSAERITCSSFKNIGVSAADTSVSNIKCIKYTEETSVHVYEHSANNIIALSSSEGISIYDSTLVGKTAEEAKAALSGVYLYYELATPQYVYFDTPFNTSIPEINKGRTWISDNNETVKVPIKADVRKYSTTVQTAEKASYSDLSGFAYRAETAVKLAPGDILPDKSLLYNLGSEDYIWKRIYGGIYNGKSINLSTAANWWRQYQWNNQMYLESMNSDGVASCMVAFNLADCNIGIGYNNPTGRVHIRREANRDYPILKVENTLASTTGYLNAIQALGPNVKNTTTLLLLGQSASSYNSGYIGFHYSGTSGSTSANYLTLGIYAKDKVLNIFGNGCVAINSTTVANVNLYVNGTSAFTGDVTFGSTTSINFNYARYTTSSTEAFEPYTLAIGNGPWCRDFWHDHFAFRRDHTIVDQEVSADGTTWTADTRNINDLFIRKDNTNVALLTADERAFRFTLTGSNFNYSSIMWFEVGSAWQSTPANVKVTIEYYSNDTWTVCSEGLISSLAAKFFKNSASFGVVPKIRFTFAKQDPYTGTFAAAFLRAYSSRKGGQGLGMEYEYPYTWDAYSNILPITDICSSLGSASKRWLNVYASYMAVKKTGAEDVLLKIMNSTGSVYLGKTASGRGYVGSKEAYTFEIWTNGNSRMTVASDGKIGINTTSPTHLLTVYGDSYVSGKMCVGTGGNNSYISSDSTTNIFLHTSSGAALVCDGAIVRPSYSLSSTSQLGLSSCPWAKAYITELHIGDATITWDSTNNTLKVDKSFTSTGEIVALG